MMGFTFVTDCVACFRLLSTCPHGHAVAGAFSAERLNCGLDRHFMGYWVSGSHLGQLFRVSITEIMACLVGDCANQITCTA
jgi:hypothetical protein